MTVIIGCKLGYVELDVAVSIFVICVDVLYGYECNVVYGCDVMNYIVYGYDVMNYIAYGSLVVSLDMSSWMWMFQSLSYLWMFCMDMNVMLCMDVT
jgi:hypothetical protein